MLSLDSDLNPVWEDQQGISVTVDEELSANSTNPVQNKVIASAIESKVSSSLMKKCELVEIEGSTNKWNKDNANSGYMYTNGQVYTGRNYDNFCYCDPIDVQAVMAVYILLRADTGRLRINIQHF